MRIRASLLALALFAGLPALFPAQAASPFADAASELDGHWEGENFVLKIDSKRAQASLDPARPFQWQRFLIQSVSGSRISFSIGADLFEAEVQSEAIRLTGSAFRGERMLQRQEPAPLDAPSPSRIEPGFRGSEE